MAEGGSNKEKCGVEEGDKKDYQRDTYNFNFERRVDSFKITITPPTSRRQSLVDSVAEELEGLELDETAGEMIDTFDNENVDPEDPIVKKFWGTIKRKIAYQHLEEQDEKIAQDYKERADATFKKGKLLCSERNYMHAVTAFYASANLHREKNDGDNSVKSITACVQEMREIVKKMVKERPEKVEMVMKRIIPLAKELKDLIQSIPTSKNDVRVLNEAVCLFYIALCYSSCDEYKRYAEVNETLIDYLEKEFKGQAEECKIYAKSLNNAGKAYSQIGDRREADKYYKMAQNAYVKATDWEDDEEKNRFQEKIEKNNFANEKKMKK